MMHRGTVGCTTKRFDVGKSLPRAGRSARKFGIGLLSAVSLIASASSEAQEQRRLPQLCFLTFDPGTLQTRSPRFDGFFEGMKDHGYVHGRNINIIYLSADNNGGRFPSLIEECLRQKPDVIAVTTTPAAHLLKKATRTVPIVMVALGDPLRTGLVDSLARPSENITGMSLMVPEVAVKRLELLTELVPGIARVLVLSFLADPIAPLQVKAMEASAPSLRVTLQVHDIRSAEDLAVAFSAASSAGTKGVVVTEESMFIVHRARVAALAAQYKLPVIYPFVLPVKDSGGLMAYAVRAPDLHRNAAAYVDRILKGAKVSTLPVQQPTRFELVINLKAAKAIGLVVPEPLLDRATELID
jgi:putative ABC transport system substrate-binding protein